MKRLSEIEVGGRAVVRHLECARGLRLRLMAMGLVRGAMVRVRGRAPMGDPTDYLVKGYDLTMRREEAGCVLVEPLAVLSLAEAEPGRWRVIGVNCHKCVRIRLWQVGVVEDADVTKLAGTDAGSVTIEAGGERQTFGKDLAERIQVVRLESETEAEPE